MATLITRMRALTHDDEGQDLIEYALLAGLISLVAVTAMATAGDEVGAFFANRVTAKLGEVTK
jgi:Flp pilus assembly pilin Flp